MRVCVCCGRYQHGPLVNRAFELLVENYSQREYFIKTLDRLQLLDASKAKLQELIDIDLKRFHGFAHGFVLWASELHERKLNLYVMHAV